MVELVNFYNKNRLFGLKGLKTCDFTFIALVALFLVVLSIDASASTSLADKFKTTLGDKDKDLYNTIVWAAGVVGTLVVAGCGVALAIMPDKMKVLKIIGWVLLGLFVIAVASGVIAFGTEMIQT